MEDQHIPKADMEAVAPPPPPESPASLRWAILRRSLLRRPSSSAVPPDHPSELRTKNVSRKKGGGFNLIPCHPLDESHVVEGWDALMRAKDLADSRDVCIFYKLPLEIVPGLVMIQRMEDSLDLNDFDISRRYDIDTTGLVCCWPSEDILAYFCANRPHIFRSKRVIELGSGYGLAGLAIAASSDAQEVVISDGNPDVVDYIQRNISVNAKVFGATKVKPMTLHWNQNVDSDVSRTFDIIVASDCTFFKEFHGSLACTVKSLLKDSEMSEAIFLSPKRGNSLDKFLEKIKENELNYELVENYDTRVWNIHQKLLSDNVAWPNYDSNHCYPLFVRVTLSRT
ncbi:calmodulin-lysine N-methyltransferase isoform X1 [Canna indica]|uniref:Calmodulin-lysine N-methyltransferase n=1 Tax=Canna indica TaxID=4628 RepID=A0AAQ3KRN8_9LILI|nr:calmodulin-lysine N-methyltransferase isoform X1 [Canna indica]